MKIVLLKKYVRTELQLNMKLVLYRSDIGVRLLGTKKLEFLLRGLRALIKIP
jgi:hypothetical protein